MAPVHATPTNTIPGESSSGLDHGPRTDWSLVVIGNPNNLRREQFRVAQAANEQAAREREIDRLSRLTTKAVAPFTVAA